MTTMIPGGSRWEKERENVGPGWRPIIERLHADLLDIAPNYEVLQIKEKFGGLRYYVATGEDFHTDRTDVFWTRIQAAEDEAAGTCEDCGSDDETVRNATLGPGRHWYLTLCESCRYTRRGRATLQQIIEDSRG